jgi:tryptophan-rich sensory protein
MLKKIKHTMYFLIKKTRYDFCIFKKLDHMQHAKRYFYYYFIHKCLVFAFQFFFLEMKTTQNKSKGCLSNTLFNQISLNKKKSNQTRSKY